MKWPDNIPLPRYYCPACRLSRIPPHMAVCSRCTADREAEAILNRCGATFDGSLWRNVTAEAISLLRLNAEKRVNEGMQKLERDNVLLCNQLLYADDKPASKLRKVLRALERTGEAVIRAVIWLSVILGFLMFSAGMAAIGAIIVMGKWATAIALLKSLFLTPHP